MSLPSRQGQLCVTMGNLRSARSRAAEVVTSTLARWAVKPSLVASTCTSGARCFRPSLLKCRTLLAAEEIVGRKSAGESGRAAGGQHVRRAGRVVAQGHRRVIAQKHRPGVVDLLGQFLGVLRGDVQVLGGDLVGQARRPRRHRGRESPRRTPPGFAGPGRRAPGGPTAAKARPPPRPTPPRSSRSARWPRGVLGLGDQVHRRELGPGRFVDDHHHFARAGDRVDVHLAEDVFLGQRHEQVARPDDLVDPRNAPRRRRPARRRPGRRPADRLR